MHSSFVDFGRLKLVHACSFLILLFCFPGRGFGAWELRSDRPLLLNADTTVSLQYKSKVEEGNSSGVLWLVASEPDSILLPETVQYRGGKAAIPVFVRASNPVLLVHDAARNETSTITLATKIPKGRRSWLPSLTIDFPTPPVVLANQEVTPTLTLAGGHGAMPPAAHISSTDHRGRLVVSRFFSTFDLLGGLGKIQFPAAGQYTVRLRLLDDDVTSLPSAAQREPVQIPFGTWVPSPELQDLKSSDYVTTDVVVGNIMAFEHIPTTATVLSEDRVEVPVFGVHSKESRLNRWPYMISDTDIYSMPVKEQRTRGAEMLTWHEALGATFGLIYVNWSHVQVSPQSYRWNKLVDLLPLYRGNHVRPVVALVGRAAWNESLPTETTQTLAAWQNFTRELSEKYRKLIWGLQVWQNPQVALEGIGDYAKLINATFTGFSTRDGKRIQAAPVLAGASHGVDVEFIKGLLESEARDAIGGISFDLYPRNHKAPPVENGFEKAFSEIISALKEAGKEDLPVWLMNTGWINGTKGVTQELQANYLVRAYTLALAHGFYKVGWNTLADESRLPWDPDPRKRFGLMTVDLRPKLSAVAYNVMSYLMSGVTLRETTAQGKARIFAFNIPMQSNKWSGVIYVAWTESPHETQDVLLNITQGGGLYVLDYLGAEIPAVKVEPDPTNPLSGTYRIPVGFEPVFIWDAGKPGNSSTPPTDVNQE